jgi:hypothetical protein
MIETNLERAETALPAIDAFNQLKHTVPVEPASLEPVDEDERDQLAEDIQDLIGNLCHACRAAGIDPKEIIENAYGGFLGEEIEESGALDPVEVAIVVDEDSLRRAREAVAPAEA